MERAFKHAWGVAPVWYEVGALPLIPIPPLAEPHRIVAKVEQQMALVDQLEAQFTRSRSTAESLPDALVTKLTASSANGAPHPSPGQRPGKPDSKPPKG